MLLPCAALCRCRWLLAVCSLLLCCPLPLPSPSPLFVPLSVPRCWGRKCAAGPPPDQGREQSPLLTVFVSLLLLFLFVACFRGVSCLFVVCLCLRLRLRFCLCLCRRRGAWVALSPCRFSLSPSFFVGGAAAGLRCVLLLLVAVCCAFAACVFAFACVLCRFSVAPLFPGGAGACPPWRGSAKETRAPRN